MVAKWAISTPGNLFLLCSASTALANFLGNIEMRCLGFRLTQLSWPSPLHKIPTAYVLGQLIRQTYGFGYSALPRALEVNATISAAWLCISRQHVHR